MSLYYADPEERQGAIGGGFLKQQLVTAVVYVEQNRTHELDNERSIYSANIPASAIYTADEHGIMGTRFDSSSGLHHTPGGTNPASAIQILNGTLPDAFRDDLKKECTTVADVMVVADLLESEFRFAGVPITTVNAKDTFRENPTEDSNVQATVVISGTATVINWNLKFIPFGAHLIMRVPRPTGLPTEPKSMVAPLKFRRLPADQYRFGLEEYNPIKAVSAKENGPAHLYLPTPLSVAFETLGYHTTSLFQENQPPIPPKVEMLVNLVDWDAGTSNPETSFNALAANALVQQGGDSFQNKVTALNYLYTRMKENKEHLKAFDNFALFFKRAVAINYIATVNIVGRNIVHDPVNSNTSLLLV